MTQVQDLGLHFVELHEVCIGPSLKYVKVPLDGIPSLHLVNSITQPGIVSELVEGALDHTVHVTNKDIEEYQPQQ